MLVTGDHGRAVRARGPGIRLIAALVIVAATACFIPLAQPLIADGRFILRLSTTTHTQLTSLIAAVTALLIFRRITVYPGTRAFGFIFPAYSTTFGIAAVTLLVFRISYSGSMLLVGYFASIMVTFALGYLDQRASRLQIHYVPLGNIDLVADAPQIDWVPMTTPVVPATPGAVIVADLRLSHEAEWERMLAAAAVSGVPVYHSKQLHESLTGRVQIEHLSENSFGSLLPALGYSGIKRVIDLLAALVLLPLLTLPLLIVALLVKRSSPGPVLFRQKRMGHRGEPFTVLKFRTMVCENTIAGSDTARQSAITQTDDRRVTSIGRFLRRSRIDELPQIFNILRGEMSWIGPRPEAIALSEWYERELPFYVYRHIVRPGITGWAQVNQGHVAGLDDVHVKLHYDFYYIKFFSAWLDMLIAFRTVGIILTGFGSK